MLSTRYDFHTSEDKIYDLWLESGIFNAVVDSSKQPYCVVIPPPNVTGSLHLGHALNDTLQDILVRYKRMCGFSALFQPGTDHAGIATQFVVEKELAKENLTRFKLGREKFIQRVMGWKATYEKRITDQLKKIGSSCDWSRVRFTMDEQYTKAVLTAFKRLYDKGYIYKGKYLVNWCPRCRTALSDLEVIKRSEKGKLYFIRYRIKDTQGKYVEIATTRPETLLGDTACAFNPDDRRYKHLAGTKLIVPLVEREIPLVADNFVMSDFGTGLVKITPAHDFNDYECGKRHNLQIISVFDESAVVNENGVQYKGLDRFSARKKVIEDLESRGLISKVDDYEIALGKCSRCSEILEPFLSDQWFIKMKELAEPCLRVIKEGRVKFVPDGWEQIAIQWLENIHDWCISRQLWWGHRIPIFVCKNYGCLECSVDSVPQKCKNCNGPVSQVEDVLDTWFSSALWPIATLGWPEETPELKYFYPTAVLVTGRDIINLWVSRMIMMGLEFMNEIPFSNVFIHSTVLTLEGQRHSKSKGVGFDPLEVVNEYGADSLRFILCRKTTGLQDLRLDKPPKDNSIVEARNFVTKLYNASRYVFGKLEGVQAPIDLSLTSDDLVNIEDKWIVSALNRLRKESAQLLESYRFGDYAKCMYEFVWDNYCDYYLELSKSSSNKSINKILSYVLVDLLKMLHPVMPFVSEELWQESKKYIKLDSELLIKCRWPQTQQNLISADSQNKFEFVVSCVKAVRSTRSRFNIVLKEPLDIVLSKDPEIREMGKILSALANVRNVTVSDSPDESSVCDVVGELKLFISLKGKIDLKLERERLVKRKEEFESRVANLSKRLSDKSFIERAPADVVEETKNDLAILEAQMHETIQVLQRLG
ncbi:MAG: valine--tRNA ligase [Planctomycetes bacterium]|nr:valine--tRNA ligase [Planctomycetota bacterium]